MGLVTMALLIGIVVTSCGRVDENAAANTLFVETGQLLTKASSAAPTEAIRLYEKALQQLDRIVTTYPKSTLAVQIVSGQAIGEISRAGTEQALFKVRQVECSQRPRSECVLAEALEGAKGIREHYDRASVFAEIAVAQIRNGHKDQARSTIAMVLQAAQEIDDSDKNAWPGRRTAVLQGIAVLQASAGETPAALAIVRRIEDGEERVTTLCAIAEVQFEANEKQQAGARVAEALEIVKEINDHEKRALRLGTLAVTQAKMGNVEDARASLATALQIARDFKKSSQRDAAFRAIGAAQAKAGDIPAALALVEEIKEPYDHARALYAIARTQIDIAQKDAASYTLSMAFNFARSVKESYLQPWLLCDIAEAFAETGDIENALATSPYIGEKENKCRNKVLQAIAVAQAKTGDIITAIQTTRGIEALGWRATTFGEPAAIQGKAGDKAAARRMFGTALETARRVEESWVRAFTLTSISRTLRGINFE